MYIKCSLEYGKGSGYLERLGRSDCETHLYDDHKKLICSQ